MVQNLIGESVEGLRSREDSLCVQAASPGSCQCASIDQVTKYCQGAPSISASFAEMGGKQCHCFLAGSIALLRREAELEGNHDAASGKQLQLIAAVLLEGNRGSGADAGRETHHVVIVEKVVDAQFDL